MKVTVGQDEVGTYVNCFLEDLANRSQSEQVMTAGGKHFLATRVNGGPAASVLVDKKCQQNLTETFFFAKPFGGGSVADLRYFSSLLNEPGMTLSTEQAVRNGVPHVVLKGISKLLGEYEFWLTDETEPHLVRAVIRKHGQNEYSPYPGVKQLLSDPLRPDPVVLATLGEAQKNCKSSPIRKSRLYSLV